jgi:TolA-binding protein
MSEQLDTTVDVDNNQPVTTDAVKSDESPKTPKAELKDGKLFVDGVRVYSRDDTNRIAATARKEVESKLLQDLQVDNFDQVKNVVQQLRGAEEGDTLNVQSLRDAVKKKEQTVEELRAELSKVKTDSLFKEHLGQLSNNMPAQWNTEQRAAVVDLMKARNMLQLEGDTFAIRNGETFFTDASGERPDYAAAVLHIGKTLGLPVTKQGVQIHNTPDNNIDDTKTIKALDSKRLQSDAAYRNAYVQVRNRDINLSHGDITDAMVKKYMEGHSRGSASERMLSNTSRGTPNKPNSRR